jgi:hypothetical protein
MTGLQTLASMAIKLWKMLYAQACLLSLTYFSKKSNALEIPSSTMPSTTAAECSLGSYMYPLTINPVTRSPDTLLSTSPRSPGFPIVPPNDRTVHTRHAILPHRPSSRLLEYSLPSTAGCRNPSPSLGALRGRRVIPEHCSKSLRGLERVE